MKGTTLEEIILTISKITKKDSVQSKNDYRKWITAFFKNLLKKPQNLNS